MEESFDIPRLLKLRKLTRAVSDYLEGRLREHLSVMRPLFDPHAILGEYIRGSSGKERTRGADKALKQLQQKFGALRGERIFRFEDELKAPLDIYGASAEISPHRYVHKATTDEGEKAITVTTPCQWVLSYAGQGPDRLRSLQASQPTSEQELRVCVLHYLVMELVMSRSPGVASLLEGLRYQVGVERLAAFGSLPVVFISAPVTTIRPPDDIMIQSTEVSGSPAFEEVVSVEDIEGMEDPLREKLSALIGGQPAA